MALIVRRSKIHGDGAYATAPIAKGRVVAEYTGPRLTNEQADVLYDHSPRTYLFGLIDGEHVIDGDGIAAFINHSCDPNCEADEVKGRVIIRAIGPSLNSGSNPVPGALQDPILELRDGAGNLMAVNDNWVESTQSADIMATTLAPSHPLESAILATLRAGSYTAILRGVNNTTGVALVEVYDLDP